MAELNQAWRNKEAFTDAAGAGESRSSSLYTDLDLFFSKNNITGDVNQLTDVQAVKRSIRNLVLTDQYEKPFHPEIYSGVRGQLFELMTPTTAVIIARQVEDVIVNFEPRARLVGVRAAPDLERNIYEITIEFYVVNAPTELVSLALILERVR
jgi:phage baseplate assembly protein W